MNLVFAVIFPIIGVLMGRVGTEDHMSQLLYTGIFLPRGQVCACDLSQLLYTGIFLYLVPITSGMAVGALMQYDSTGAWIVISSGMSGREERRGRLVGSLVVFVPQALGYLIHDAHHEGWCVRLRLPPGDGHRPLLGRGRNDPRRECALGVPGTAAGYVPARDEGDRLVPVDDADAARGIRGHRSLADPFLCADRAVFVRPGPVLGRLRGRPALVGCSSWREQCVSAGACGTGTRWPR